MKRETPMAMTLDEAKLYIGAGGEFGDVYPNLKEGDQSSLKEWFVRTAGIPNLRPRQPKPIGVSEVQMGLDTCAVCGSQQFMQTGTCKTCANCGQSLGGCG